MSSPEAASYTVAIVVALLGAAFYLICRAADEHSDRRARRSYLQANWDEATSTWSDNDGHDVGPDALRLMQEMDRILDAHMARLEGLFEELGPPPTDPAWDAGRERLWDAIRDEHTNHQGDQ